MNYKQLIVESGKRMSGSGLTVETWGNISFRDKETGLVYLTPSAMLYDTIVEDDVVVCRLDGTIVEGERKPTIETEMHLSVYRNREDVNAIIHTHPIYSMVYAAQGKDIPLIIDEAAQILGDVCRCADYALPGSAELAENCVKALGERSNSCLIHSHGAVCVSGDMDGAFKTAKVLEVTAQIYYMIEATGGKPAGISDENIKAMQDFVKNSYGQGK
ncbi:class II aldolase/adducin family protein [Lachnospiraceae bacterium MD308]|nr:class II aldolase/adducin family protein [Lachnospiraceae bacterium MD308]MCI8580678.1 class II aldolase/adducin family protein [Dorea sp.]